ncbi:hypothetical protein NPIL_171791 [Nephila pilipes]|uniref:Uncharacterized protein n=1 Tax=Nephila pilipes TaxID=299642 RepID=A0A8X6MZ14_NEPPI|nr:hypothetical protein NPIL_171791 [Nephila pilipes]
MDKDEWSSNTSNTDLNELSEEELRNQLTSCERLLTHANLQIDNLNQEEHKMHMLCERAKRNGCEAIFQNLLMQKSTSVGVKLMFYRFALHLERKIKIIREKLDNYGSRLSHMPDEDN